MNTHQISMDFFKAFGGGTSQRRANRGPRNELHMAAAAGSLPGVRGLLSRGSIDIDDANPEGYTPLMIAAEMGHTDVVKHLVDMRAYPREETDRGATALHLACENGHLDVCKLLIPGAENLEETTDEGYTCLHLSSHGGHTGVMKALIKAGESTDSRLPDGRTPLHLAAMEGKVAAVRVLLRADADPLLTSRTTPVNTYTPLDTAVRHGRFEVVRELIQKLGLRRCAGASGGTEALRLAAQNDHVDILTTLAEAGVQDMGTALVGAIGYGCEAPVKVLLQLKERSGRGYLRGYVNMFAMIGNQLMGTPLLLALGFARHKPLPRIVRMLIDAGADTKSAVTTRENQPDGTPLEFVTRFIRERKVDGEEATEEQMHKLEAIRRLLLTVEAAHATSWLWQKNVPSLSHAGGVSRRTRTVSTSLRMMLPVLRRRATKRGLAPETASRFSRKLR